MAKTDPARSATTSGWCWPGARRSAPQEPAVSKGLPVARIGIIGDVHGQDDLLAGALELFAEQGIDVVVCTGDVVDGPGDADRCVALLRDAGVLTARGNHDRWLLHGELRDLHDAHRAEHLAAATTEWLGALRPQERLETAHGQVLLCHGLGDDDMNRLAPDQFGYALEVNDALHVLLAGGLPRVVVKGHTHRRGVYTCGPLTVIDAGTLAEHGPPSVSVLDLGQQHVTAYTWDGAWRETDPVGLPTADRGRPLPRSHTDLPR